MIKKTVSFKNGSKKLDNYFLLIKHFFLIFLLKSSEVFSVSTIKLKTKNYGYFFLRSINDLSLIGPKGPINNLNLTQNIHSKHGFHNEFNSNHNEFFSNFAKNTTMLNDNLKYFTENNFLYSNDTNISTNKVFLKIAQANWKHPLFGILLISITLTTIFGNCLVIFAIIRERCLKSANNYYIASLALADLIVGLVVMPFNSINEMANSFWFFGDLW